MRSTRRVSTGRARGLVALVVVPALVAVAPAAFGPGAPPDITGPARGDQAGYSIANVGDVNGDGYDEIAVGMPLNDDGGNNAGRVTVYDGQTKAAIFSVTGQANGNRFGSAVAAAGDVNRDGVPDVVVGAPRYARSKGAVYVYSGDDGRRLHRVTGKRRGDRFGAAVAGGFDVNGDRRDDFVVGAPKNDDGAKNAGRIYVYSGRNGRLLGSRSGQAKGDKFGSTVAMLRANDDRFGDIVVGAPKADDGSDRNIGKVYVYNGRTMRRMHTNMGRRAGDQFGSSLAALHHDVGRHHYVVGSPFFDKPGRGKNAGQFSGFNGKTGRKIYTKSGWRRNDRFGEVLADAGSIFGSDRHNIAVGMPKWGSGGIIALRSGHSGGPVGWILGEQTGHRFGSSIATGCFAASGGPDLAIGAPRDDTSAPDAGAVYVVPNDEIYYDGARYDPDDHEHGDELGTDERPTLLGTFFPESAWADELVNLLAQWGEGGDADENRDGVVDFEDLLELLDDR